MINIPESVQAIVPNHSYIIWANARVAVARDFEEANATLGCEAAAAALEKSLAAIDAGLARFEQSVALLAEAYAALQPLAVAVKLAEAMHERGAETLKDALRLSNDLEFAKAKNRVAFRAFEAARSAVPVLAGVPTDGAAMTRGKQIAEAMTSHEAVKLFHPARVNATGWKATWDEYLEIDPSWLTYVPLAIARICIESDEAWFKHKDDTPWEGGTTEYPHSEDLRALWKQLLEDRESKRKAKLAAARRMAAQAEAEAEAAR